MAGSLPQLPGERPTLDDWSDHLTTLFPEVRMKRFLEMRGADGGRWRRICALPAFWTGLLYDQTALDAAWDLVKDWTAEERQALARSGARRRRCAPPSAGTTVLEMARQAAGDRPRRPAAARPRTPRATTSASSSSRSRRSCAKGCTPAEEMLLRYEGEWGRRTDPLFGDYAF